MKAMILAAGLGKRLRPLTETTAKPLLEVAGRSLLERHLVNLAKVGVSDVVINVFHCAGQVRDVIGDGSRFGLRIHYSEETKLLDTGGGIAAALPWLGDAPFLLVNGDILTHFDFQQLVAHDLGKYEAHLVLVPTPAGKAHHDFCLDAGLVRREPARLTYGCMAKISPRLFAGVTQEVFSLTVDLLFAKADLGLVSGEQFDGYWSDIGTLDSFEQARQAYIERD